MPLTLILDQGGQFRATPYRQTILDSYIIISNVAADSTKTTPRTGQEASAGRTLPIPVLDEIFTFIVEKFKIKLYHYICPSARAKQQSTFA